MTTTGVKM